MIYENFVSGFAALCYNLVQREDFKSSFICLWILFTARAGGRTQIPLKIHPRISKKWQLSMTLPGSNKSLDFTKLLLK